MDFGANGSLHGRSGSWGRTGQLPSFSHAFSTIMNGHGYAGLGHADHFFVPSYLKGSKYIQRLEEAHKARVQAQKEDPQAPSSQSGSLSTSASSLNLHTKLAPSHRGMAYDIIEKAPPVEDESVPRLPSKWNSSDKYGGLEVLSDGQEVKFTGPKSDRDRDHEACAIRADYPMPTQCGIYYYEVTIISRKREEYAISPQYLARCDLTLSLGVLLESDFRVRACHYQDYPGGNPSHGHITAMTDIHLAAKARASIMDRLLLQLMLLVVG